MRRVFLGHDTEGVDDIGDLLGHFGEHGLLGVPEARIGDSLLKSDQLVVVLTCRYNRSLSATCIVISMSLTHHASNRLAHPLSTILSVLRP